MVAIGKKNEPTQYNNGLSPNFSAITHANKQGQQAPSRPEIKSIKYFCTQ